MRQDSRQDETWKQILFTQIAGLNESRNNIDDFITAIEGSFDLVQTEALLDRELEEQKVYTPLTKCVIVKMVDKAQKTRKKRKKSDTTDAEVYDADGNPVATNPRKRIRESDGSDTEDDDNTPTDVPIPIEQKGDDEYEVLKGLDDIINEASFTGSH